LRQFGEVQKITCWFVKIVNINMLVSIAAPFLKEYIKEKEIILQPHIQDAHTIHIWVNGREEYGE